MSETTTATSAGGAVIRRAREARGLSIESLASTLKVSPAKLQALENGAHDALPDLAFARALAKTVCRHLGIDPEPVLASLPSAQPVNLGASEPKGVPFKATKARLNLDANPGWQWQPALQARWLVPLGILVAAALLHFWPQDTAWLSAWWPVRGSELAGAPSPSASLPDDLAARNAVASELAASGDIEPVLAQPPVAPSAVASAVPVALPSASESVASTPSDSAAVPGLASVAAAAPMPGANLAPVAAGQAPLVLVAEADSWVEVRQIASGQKLLSRHLKAGESVSLDVSEAAALKIGNAVGVRVQYRGQPIELPAFTRNNVARLELK
jgi:cytoskeleton protein RodZ